MKALHFVPAWNEVQDTVLDFCSGVECILCFVIQVRYEFLNFSDVYTKFFFVILQYEIIMSSAKHFFLKQVNKYCRSFIILQDFFNQLPWFDKWYTLRASKLSFSSWAKHLNWRFGRNCDTPHIPKLIFFKMHQTFTFLFTL